MASFRLRPDSFTLALAATVALASVLPASGAVGAFLERGPPVGGGAGVLIHAAHR